MTKDRLGALQAASKYSNNSFDADEFSNAECDQGGAVNFGYRLFMEYEYLNDFMSEVDRVRKDIDWLKENVNEMKKKHSSILSRPMMNDELRRELEDQTDSITKMAGKIKAKLKEFEKEVERAKKANPTSAEVRMRRMQHETLSRMFVDVMIECNIAQAHHRERCKERFKRQLEIMGNTTTDEQLDEMLEQGNPPILTVFDINIEVSEAQSMLADIKTRHKDFMQLEKSIIELNSLFKEMAMYVDRQGDLINRIDYNVLNAVEYVDNGQHHTKRALVYKNKIRWKRMILMGVGASLLIIIIICLATTLSGKK